MTHLEGCRGPFDVTGPPRQGQPSTETSVRFLRKWEGPTSPTHLEGSGGPSSGPNMFTHHSGPNARMSKALHGGEQG
jgi:hypothetical protein